MGSFDGAELCELVSLYILHILGEKYEKHRIDLFWDDELACFEYTTGPQANIITKDFIKIFKEDFDLSITCETNLKAVNFLDVPLTLITDECQVSTPDIKLNHHTFQTLRCPKREVYNEPSVYLKWQNRCHQRGNFGF